MDDMIDLINQVSEFSDIHEFIQDDGLDEAMAAIVKIISKPDIPPTQALVLIAKLQALSAKFGILASWYSTAAKGPTGTPNNIKKNIYYSSKEAIDKLVDSLKYIVRYNLG